MEWVDSSPMELDENTKEFYTTARNMHSCISVLQTGPERGLSDQYIKRYGKVLDNYLATLMVSFDQIRKKENSI